MMIIREARKDDLEQLNKIFDAYRLYYRKDSDLKASRIFLEQRMIKGDSCIFVAEHTPGELAGFTQLYPLFSSTRMRKLWLLNDLFVLEAFRGQGVAHRLIERSKQCVRESGAFGMFLETEKSNTIGNHLYPSAGMRLNTTSNYYEWEA